jgi:hypothetical protein
MFFVVFVINLMRFNFDFFVIFVRFNVVLVFETWSKNYYFNSLSLILVRCTKIGYDVTRSKNGVTCKQTRTQMSEDTLESHIIYGLKGKYLLNRKVNFV